MIIVHQISLHINAVHRFMTKHGQISLVLFANKSNFLTCLFTLGEDYDLKFSVLCREIGAIMI